MNELPAARGMLSPYGLAVVTGGSSGIGKCFITSIQEDNPAVRICNLSRRDPAIPKVDNMVCDLANVTERMRVFARLRGWVEERAEVGKLLLINNSGFGLYGAFPEPKMTEQSEMIAVNIAAMVELTAVLLPALRSRGGAVINVASTSAFQPTPYFATYGATKAFVLHWSVALQHELREDGVHVQALCPGPTRTAFRHRAGFDRPVVADRWSQQPREVVSLSLGALARRKPIVVTGTLNRLAASLVGLLPRPWAANLAGRVIGHYRLPDPPA